VRNVKATISGTLHGGKDLGTDGGADEADVQKSFEGTTGVIINLLLDVELFAISFLNSLEGFFEVELFQQTTSDQQTGGVGGGKVGQTSLDTVIWELGREGLAHDLVTADGWVDNLAHNLAVGVADDQTITRGIVLVLLLSGQVHAGLVIGLTLPSPATRHLEAFEIRFVFYDLNETHCCYW